MIRDAQMGIPRKPSIGKMNNIIETWKKLKLKNQYRLHSDELSYLQTANITNNMSAQMKTWLQKTGSIAK